MSAGYEAGLLLQSLGPTEVNMTAACKEFDCSWAEVMQMRRDGLLTLRIDTAAGCVYLSEVSAGNPALKVELIHRANNAERYEFLQRPDLWAADLIADAKRLPLADRAEVYEAAIMAFMDY